MKELPYFKFFPSEWITGDITLCSFEAQGLFINLISFYWQKNCSMYLANAKQRYSKAVANVNDLLEELKNNDIIVVDEDDRLYIKFLDEQMSEFINLSETRSKAGRKGGLAKAKQLPEFAKAKPSYKEIEKNKNKIKKYKPDCDSLWNLYPNKDGKKKALIYMKSSIKSEQDYNDCIKAIKNYKDKIEVEKIEPKYIKNGSTFFNNWQDYVDYVKPEEIPEWKRILQS